MDKDHNEATFSDAYVQTTSTVTSTHEKLFTENKMLLNKFSDTHALLEKTTKGYSKLKGEHNTRNQKTAIFHEHEKVSRKLVAD